MYRKRRKIRYYSGPVSRERLRDKPWFPYAVIALAALVLALIVGSILGGVADKTGGKVYERKNLHDFGGVEEAEERFASVPALDADYLSLSGMDNGDIRGALSDLEFGDGVAVLLYEDGKVYYSTDLEDTTSVSLTEMSSVSLSTFADRADSKGRVSIGVFVSSAFAEEGEAARILARAEEMAILSEIATSGMDELLLVGLPSDPALAVEVNAYLRELSAILDGRMRLGVAVDGKEEAADMAHTVAASVEYADRFALDLRGLSDEELTAAIEANAYYLTYYRMRVMFDTREQYEIVSSYGLSGGILIGIND